MDNVIQFGKQLAADYIAEQEYTILPDSVANLSKKRKDKQLLREAFEAVDAFVSALEPQFLITHDEINKRFTVEFLKDTKFKAGDKFVLNIKGLK